MKIIIAIGLALALMAGQVWAEEWPWPVIQEERVGNFTLTVIQNIEISEVFPTIIYKVNTVLWLTDPNNNSNIVWSRRQRIGKKRLKIEIEHGKELAKKSLELRKEILKEIGQ